jgi:hypothetical protein
MDLIDFLLKHLSVNKLITAMKDRGFVPASSHLSPTHFPQAQSLLHLPLSPTHHVPAPPPPAQTLPPQTVPTQLLQGGNGLSRPDSATQKERGRENKRETEEHGHTGVCRAYHSSTSASARPSHRSSLAHSLSVLSKGANKKIKAMLHN